jgi:hypothetical protein
LVLIIAALRFLLRRGLKQSRFDRVELFIGLICVGVVVNALICGVLGGPFDRYQSRVIWLIPAVAGALLLFSREKLDVRAALAEWRSVRAAAQFLGLTIEAATEVVANEPLAESSQTSESSSQQRRG